MLEKFDDRMLLYVLVFPAYFQEPMIRWAWGAQDDTLVMLAKRILLLLPCASIVLCLWVTVACLITVIFRHQRSQFVSTLFVTWWDLARSIFAFWGGFFKFIFYLLGWAFSFLRLIVFGLWLSIQDILLAPLRAVWGVTDIASKPGTPWIAVWMTLAYCAVEAAVLTIMMTYLVVDIIAGVTQGFVIDVWLIQIVLFLFLCVVLVGSYAMLATIEDAIRRRNFKMVWVLIIVELAAWLFEVGFLYREFVDAMVPAIAQYAGDGFSIGLPAQLAIASIAWFGMRGFTWFLFASHGTPTILAIIQRSGLKSSEGGGISFKKKDHFTFIRAALDKIKQDINWVHIKGDEVVSAFVLPPMQIVAASINFFTLLVSAKHLFDLPFKSYKDMLHADQLVSRIKDKG